MPISDAYVQPSRDRWTNLSAHRCTATPLCQITNSRSLLQVCLLSGAISVSELYTFLTLQYSTACLCLEWCDATTEALYRHLCSNFTHFACGRLSRSQTSELSLVPRLSASRYTIAISIRDRYRLIVTRLLCRPHTLVLACSLLLADGVHTVPMRVSVLSIVSTQGAKKITQVSFQV